MPGKEAREACKTALENRSNKSSTTEDVLQMMNPVIETWEYYNSYSSLS